MHCPLISVLGATNEVPEDEVTDAFFDRFLVRLPVAPVSSAGFGALLERGNAAHWTAPPELLLLRGPDLIALTDAARGVSLPESVLTVLAELRQHMGAQGVVVSDRRWVKIVALLRVAAASQARDAVALWDLLLLPWLTAPDAGRQAQVADWLAARLGVRTAFSPARLTLLVEAFERQLDNERNANDLDYDESGRLKFSATEIAGEIGDAKGGAAALRMNYNRKRRYGETHIRTRLAQLDALLQRINGYTREIEAHLADLKGFEARSLWLDGALTAQASAHLHGTAAAVSDLAVRAASLREGFLALPRLEPDPGTVPEPVALEAWDAV
jgi:MoxR-like ATPase